MPVDLWFMIAAPENGAKAHLQILSSMGSLNLIIFGAVVSMMMAAVMAGGMVPPLVIAPSTTLFPNLWSKKDRSAGLANYIIGSAVAGARTAAFRCASPAPHGGLCVAAVNSHPLLYIYSVFAGALIGCVIHSLRKKPLSD
ncbi:MAG: hypothetical protein SPL40_08265 [Erysipelotrichaceae bacterium]|nr:hypothetical protein [Erysipelotrichaceae bacterium]